MMKVTLQNILKRFGTQTVVNRINLEVRSGELLCLLGPSGCGKTTVLRILAGFCEPEEGNLWFGEKPMAGVPPQHRQTAMVFQNYALWPHLSVFENVAYGLRVRRLSNDQVLQRAEEALSLVKMLDYRDRKPTQLSGGQQQRVALARAFVVQPELLLFDEPLCNLDPQLRLEMRAEIRRLQAKTGISSLYVTHDQEEALSLATRIAVMHQGVIQQIGTPFEIYNHPINTFVARFIGEINLYPASTPLARSYNLSGTEILGCRPENVRIATTGIGVPAQVTQSTYLGSKNELLLQTSEGDLVKAWTLDSFSIGSQVSLTLPENTLIRFSAP